MLSIQELKKSFPQPGGGRITILKIRDFSIDDAQQCVLIGDSGGGKTTLLHLIAGLTTPDCGQILVDGVDITKLSEAGRDRYRAAKVGYVFQTFNLLAGFSALENVRLGMSFASGKHDLQRAYQLLERVGLTDRAHYRPHQLSVGQQQRVAIARALAAKPRLLLADEPTANVDPASQQVVIDLIRQTCQDEGVALLLVTHSMEVAHQFKRIENLADINLALQTAKTTEAK